MKNTLYKGFDGYYSLEGIVAIYRYPYMKEQKEVREVTGKFLGIFLTKRKTVTTTYTEVWRVVINYRNKKKFCPALDLTEEQAEAVVNRIAELIP